jgi:hypothetical protein
VRPCAGDVGWHGLRFGAVRLSALSEVEPRSLRSVVAAQTLRHDHRRQYAHPHRGAAANAVLALHAVIVGAAPREVHSV